MLRLSGTVNTEWKLLQRRKFIVRVLLFVGISSFKLSTFVVSVLHFFCLQMSLQSEDYGKHLLSVQDLLQKHSLLEADVVTITERVKVVNGQASKFIDQGWWKNYVNCKKKSK